MPWQNRPKSIEHCPGESEYLMFVDENGSSDLKPIIKSVACNVSTDVDRNFFTITGCIIHRDELLQMSENITSLKHRYWENGMYEYKGTLKRVCFHSRDIRKKDGPFYFTDEAIYDDFICNLTSFLSIVNTKIISITINKENLCRQYSWPHDPYEISSKFLIERYTKFLLDKQARGIIVIESRSKTEDRKLHSHLKNIIHFGTGEHNRIFVDSSDFKRTVVGVYFNPKWAKESNEEKSYFGLEIADLFSHPIHSYVRSNLSTKNKAFEVLEPKLLNYPNHLGYGLKVFP